MARTPVENYKRFLQSYAGTGATITYAEEKTTMPKYDLQWSQGFNADDHPANTGGDCLVFYAFNGAPPEGSTLAEVGHSGDWARLEPFNLVGWVAIDHNGKCSGCFDGQVMEFTPPALAACFEWVREQNGEGV